MIERGGRAGGDCRGSKRPAAPVGDPLRARRALRRVPTPHAARRRARCGSSRYTREMPLAHLLVVDDEPSILTTLQKALSLEGYAVDVAGGVKVAEEKLKKRPTTSASST